MALTASVISNLGVNLQKLSFIYELRKVSSVSLEGVLLRERGASSRQSVHRPDRRVTIAETLT